MTELLLETVLLAAALSADAFTAGFSYGLGQVRVPASSIFLLSVLSTFTLALSLFAGRFLTALFPQSLTRFLSFLLLFILGIFKLFSGSENARAENANKNHDDLLSPGEAVPLGIALSADSLAAGIGAGVSISHFAGTLAAAFIFCTLAIPAGSRLGRILSRHTGEKFRFVGGVLLILLAFLKLG